MIEKNIEKIAQGVLKGLSINRAPIPIEEILRKNAIEVGMAPSEEFSGLLLRKEGGRTIVGINTDESYERQRFTMAHELGHFLLDPSKDAFVDRLESIAYRDNKSGVVRAPEEVKANKFAAALLMPEFLLKNDFEEITHTHKMFLEDHLEILSKKYLVSKNAMKFRLANLGLIRLPSTS